MIKVAMGLTTPVVTPRRETTDLAISIRTRSKTSVILGSIMPLTDITINVELDVRVVRPYDSIETTCEILEEKPEA